MEQAEKFNACPNCLFDIDGLNPFCPRCGLDLRHGSPKPITHGNCIYCEKFCKFSEEHVLPDWISNTYPQRYTRTQHYLSRPEKLELGATVHSNVELGKGSPYARKVLNVCISCNTGWMSVLTNEAKPLVQALADGCWPWLSQSDRNVLTRWIILISINLEFWGRQLKTHQYQRTSLMNGEVPGGWIASIGSLKDDSFAGRSWYRPIAMSNFQSFDGQPTIFKSTYFCIEYAAFHTYSSDSDHILSYAKYSGIDINVLPTRKIWPKPDYWDRINGTNLDITDLDSIQERLFVNPAIPRIKPNI